MKLKEQILFSLSFLGGAVLASGQTWTQTSAPVTNWTSMAASADGATVVAAVNLGGIWVSTNSGSTWMQTSAPESGWLDVVASADGKRLAAIGKPYVRPEPETGNFYISTNSGNTWISNNIPGFPEIGLISCAFASSADGQKLALAEGSMGEAIVLTSTNSGSAWLTNTLPLGSHVSIFLSADGNELIAAGMNSIVSTNFGKSWTATNAMAASSICGSADGSRCAIVSGQSILVSTDSGASWTPTSAPATNWVALAISADGGRLMAVADKNQSLQNPTPGPIYTSADGGSTWISNNVAPAYWTCAAGSADGRKWFAGDIGGPSGSAPGRTVGGGIWAGQIPASPTLFLTPVNRQFRISWIVPSTNFVLQQSTNLAGWWGVTNLPALNLTTLRNEVTLSPAGSIGFYRLKTP